MALVAIEVLFGLMLFLNGIRLFSRGLRNTAGPRVLAVLHSATKTPLSSLATGAVVTALVQSSSATNVTVVTMVHAGLLPFKSAVAVMLGANIGTTLTAQIVSLPLGRLAPAAFVVGVILWSIPQARMRVVGEAVTGFGLVFTGLEWMKHALTPLGDLPLVYGLLEQASTRPAWGIFAGILVTSVIQSSSATTGLVIAMASQGLIRLPGAIAISLGANVGTVVTTLIASLPTDREGKRAAVADLLFNVTGVLLVMPFLSQFVTLVTYTAQELPRQVANAHTLFNAVTAVVALVFLDILCRTTERLLP